MNRVELVSALAECTGTTKIDAGIMVGSMFKIITDVLASGDKVRIDDFGTFEVKDRAPRTGRNPQAGVPVHIPACRAPVFKAHRVLKDAMNASNKY